MHAKSISPKESKHRTPGRGLLLLFTQEHRELQQAQIEDNNGHKSLASAVKDYLEEVEISKKTEDPRCLYDRSPTLILGMHRWFWVAGRQTLPWD